MIVEIFIKIMTALLDLTARLLPDWNLPDVVYTSVVYFIYYTLKLNDILPITTIYKAIFSYMSFVIVILMIELVWNFITLIRGGGGASPADNAKS